jgi:hypothetical protein
MPTINDLLEMWSVFKETAKKIKAKRAAEKQKRQLDNAVAKRTMQRFKDDAQYRKSG